MGKWRLFIWAKNCPGLPVLRQVERYAILEWRERTRLIFTSGKYIPLSSAIDEWETWFWTNFCRNSTLTVREHRTLAQNRWSPFHQVWSLHCKSYTLCILVAVTCSYGQPNSNRYSIKFTEYRIWTIPLELRTCWIYSGQGASSDVPKII